jgi:hypothetical protein
MKKMILALAFLSVLGGEALCGDYSGLITGVIVPLNGEFALTLTGYTQTFVVKRSIVGTTSYNRMFAQLLTAFTKSKNVWIGTQGTSTTDVWGTTICK